MSYIPTLTTIFRFRITFFTSKSTSKPCSRNLSTTLLSVLKISRKNYLKIAVFTTLGIETPHHSNIFRASFHSASNTKFQNCFFYRLCTSKLPMKSMVSLFFPEIIFLQFSSFILQQKKTTDFRRSLNDCFIYTLLPESVIVFFVLEILNVASL